MRRVIVVVALVACGDNRQVAQVAADAAADAAPGTCSSGTNVVLQLVASVTGTPTLVTAPIVDPRLFVAIQSGQIDIVDHGYVLPEPFLDISSGVAPPFIGFDQSEQGLLGLAFHPQYATNHTFFLTYTAQQDDPDFPYLDVVMRFTTSASDPNKADLASGTVVLAVPDFASNHNGGMVEFGPDGYLYISEGDGGFADDPMRNGQDTHALLGKILRIDVDNKLAGMEYAIPADNPFADGMGGAPEVYIWGLRNPWRFSFDAKTGDMWIGDVGQDTIEEVDMLPAGEQAGANLGWSMYEGDNCFYPPCDPTGLTFPIDTRTHDSGWCAVIGGAVYRGSCFPDLDGTYFYTDNCTYEISSARQRGDGGFDIADLPAQLYSGPSMIHADSAGELYVANVFGNIYRLEATP